MRGQTEVKKISQKQKILSKDEIEEIKELYLNGVPSGTLATAFKCHRVTICNVLRKAGITVDQHIEGRKYKTEEVIRLYQEERIPIKEIARKFGVCEGSIYKCLKRNNNRQAVHIEQGSRSHRKRAKKPLERAICSHRKPAKKLLEQLTRSH